MMGRSFLLKAILAALVGIAFLFSGCRPRIPIEKEVPEKAVLEGEFARAESLFNAGELDGALEAYKRYIQLDPSGENVPLALQRMAEIHVKRSEYGEAMAVLQRLIKEHEEYPQLSLAQYYVLVVHYRLGEYEDSREAALRWLESYPKDPLKREVLDILGRNEVALGQEDKAFYWWLRAEAEFAGDPTAQSEFHSRLEGLISSATVDKLDQMKRYAAGSQYAPQIYYRLALLYLEEDELERGQRAAMDLVRSTQDQDWVTRGRRLLEQILEELSVKEGAIGCLLPLSGPFAAYGQEVLNGIQLGMANFAGLGQETKFDLVIRDTGGEPEVTITALEELVKGERVMAIIGPLASKTAYAAAKRAQELGVPIVTFTQREGITLEGPMVFRNFLTPSREVEKILDAAVNDLDAKRLAILYPENSYGRFFMDLMWDGLEARDGQVTAVESYRPDETDFAVQIKKMTGLYHPRPSSVTKRVAQMRTVEQEENELLPEEPEPIIDFDAVFIPDNYEKAAMIAPQLVYYDVLDVMLLGTSLWQSQALIELAGDYVQGSLFPSGFFPDGSDPSVAAFTENYRVNFESEPGILAATGYDTINLVRTLLADGKIRTRRGFLRGLLQCGEYTGITGKMCFDAQGEVLKEPTLLTVTGKNMDRAR